MPTPVVTLRLDSEVADRVKKAAAESDRTFTDFVRDAIATYLESEQKETPAA